MAMAPPRFVLPPLVSLAMLMLMTLSWFGQCSDAASGSVSVTLSSMALRPNRISRRHLLQVLTPCTVNFQAQNYTIITSECKGPTYPQKACCDAFVKFACPFASEINDNTTDCATRMFSYINVYGRYPSGLFANECVSNSTEGLPCPATPPSSSLATNAAPSALPAPPYATTVLSCLSVLLACAIPRLLDASLLFSDAR